MSGKPPRNTETHYNKPAGAAGSEPKSGRQRKELSPDRQRDKEKRSYKEKREEPRTPGRSEDGTFRKTRKEQGADRSSAGRADKPAGRREREGQEGFEPRGRKATYGRSSEQRTFAGKDRQAAGDRPFKKYVPFEDRKDKRTHLDEAATPGKPFADRKRDNNEPRGKRKDTGRGEEKKQKPKNQTRQHFEQEDLYEDERPFTRSSKWNEQAKAGPMTLNKYLAHSGISSRREAAEIVKAGKVKVNGAVVTEPGYRVKDGDKVTHDDKEMKPQEKMVYILLNKPKDYITTTDDEKGRKKVMDLVANAGVERLYPVGRLDRQTTGVLLITNDGDLAQKLSHPSYNSKKIYQVTLDRNLTKADFEKIIAGVKLEDGIAPVDALAYLEKKNEIGIEIHSGRNRIVRRIFEGLGYVVEKLDRVVYAGLTKKNVSRGKWRFLTEREVILLKHFKG